MTIEQPVPPPTVGVLDDSASALTGVHVCFVSPMASLFFAAQDAGGAELQQVALARGLLQRSLRVSFVVHDYGQGAFGQHDALDIVQCGFRYLGGSNLWYPGDTVSLVRTLVRLRPDIIVLKTPVTLLPPLLIAKNLTGAKVVKVMASDRECVGSGGGNLSKTRAFLVRLLYDWQLKRADGLVFQTEEQRALAAKHFGLPGMVIRNLVVRDEPAAPVAKDLDVLWVGSCWPWKRPDLFLEFAKSVPHLRCGMVASPGDAADCAKAVRDTARTIGNLQYFGFVKPAEIGPYFARAKVLAHTSDYEGFPNVFLQAWQAGVPVVSRRTDPDRVMTTHHIGLLSGTTEQLRADILGLLEDDRLRTELGERGRAYVEAHHSERTILCQYLALFGKLLGRAETDEHTSTSDTRLAGQTYELRKHPKEAI